ncbi:TK/KIN6 protein kinase [Aphelenchoides avenae]|nr:TK/KIN6 protein kinase [Aphelenchus avenae]
MPKSVNEDVIREIEIMKELSQNVHILRLLATVAPHNSVPILLLEYCANGNLQAFLRTRMVSAKLVEPASSSSLSTVVYANTEIRIRDLISFAWQVADAMTFVASKGFVHRDLAARNVLVTSSQMIKLADFGLCRHSNEALYIAHMESKLPIKWMALESLKKAEFTTKSDVWSFGVLMYEMFSAGATPYRDQHPTELSGFLASGNRLEQPQLSPTDVYDLMRECWLEKPNDRPSFEQIRKRCAKWLESFAEDYGYCQPVPDEPQKFEHVVRLCVNKSVKK